jgi:hypothetical protein
MKKLQMVSALTIAGTLVLAGCGGTDIVVGPAKPTAPAAPAVPVASMIKVDFNAGVDGWVAGVADYTDGTEPSEVASSWKDLPAPLTGKGYYLASHNRSDDVLTYAKRQVGGFVPGAKYALTFEMRYVTDASTACFGVGGSRGGSIYMVVAASADEPKTVKQADGNYRVNLERGNQAESGRQGKVLGVQGSDDLACDSGKWVAQTRKSDEAIELQADKDGKLWIMLGTDSGFEAANALYLQGATVNVKPI